MRFTRQDWFIVTGLAMTALITGWLSGAYAACLLVAAIVWILLQERDLHAFARWSQRPLARPANHLERWQRISQKLFRSLRRTRQRNRRTLQSFRSVQDITDVLPDSAVIIGAGGVIESFNSAAGDMLNLKPADRGTNLTSLVRQPDFVALLRAERPEGFIEFASPFDEERRLEARRIRIDATHALILVRDVTRLNRLLTMRQDFVANVSHELRTPLTVVIGYLETMTSEDLDIETLKSLLGRLAAPTARMQALVEDLLLLSRLEASATPGIEELDPVDMPVLIDSCVAEARELSNGRHRFEVTAERTLKLLGMERELHSAVLNMLTNAVRYSPDGGTISLTWEATGGGARLALTDQGIGIAPENLQRLTERFYRVDLAKSRIRGGTGLGLAIVKHVLKRHQSALQVTSRLGQGSRFWCDFPAALIPRAHEGSHERGRSGGSAGD